MNTPAPAPVPAATKSATVTLANPIQREGGPISTLTLRKPNAGDLQGLNIQALMVGDVTSVMTVLPRITQPIIAAHEARLLEAEDIAELAGTVMGFFMTTAQKAAIAQMMGA